jgi:hypothetical protein
MVGEVEEWWGKYKVIRRACEGYAEGDRWEGEIDGGKEVDA